MKCLDVYSKVPNNLRFTLTFWEILSFLNNFLSKSMSNDLTKIKPRLFYKNFSLVGLGMSGYVY